MHTINEHSPLYGETIESLMQRRASIVISLNGLDETVMQVIHARHTYTTQDILWNHQFTDILYDTAEDHPYIDYSYFHEVIPLE